MHNDSLQEVIVTIDVSLLNEPATVGCAEGINLEVLLSIVEAGVKSAVEPEIVESVSKQTLFSQEVIVTTLEDKPVDVAVISATGTNSDADLVDLLMENELVLSPEAKTKEFTVESVACSWLRAENVVELFQYPNRCSEVDEVLRPFEDDDVALEVIVLLIGGKFEVCVAEPVKFGRRGDEEEDE